MDILFKTTSFRHLRSFLARNPCGELTAEFKELVDAREEEDRVRPLCSQFLTLGSCR
jgi:hypothetical protein